MKTKILSTGTAFPPYVYGPEEVLEYVDQWLKDLDPLEKRKAMKIFRSSPTKQRHSILPIEQIFSPMSFEEKNNHYMSAVKNMGKMALQEALKKAKLLPKDIDCLITTSCTGFMIPSLDAYLIEELGMRQDTERLPVTEMGCAGGTAGLIYAHHFTKGRPDMKVAIVSVEAPSITLLLNDKKMENIVSTSIFADGAACTILGPTNQLGPEIRDVQMYHFPKGHHLMGFNLTNEGLQIVLDKDVPKQIEAHFPHIIFPFLERNNLSLKQVEHFIFHPGGKKILSMVESLLSPHQKHINPTREIFSQYGNMSSATVLFVLQRYLEGQSQSGDYGLMLSFGPGFMAQTLLLQWS